MSPTEETQVTITVPKASAALAAALGKAVQDGIKAKQSGDSGAKLVLDEVEVAINDLAGAAIAAPQVGADVQADALGVAEAFVVQGFEVAKQIKAAAAPAASS